MKIENIFYGVAIFFLFITVGYFVGSYLNEVPSSIKAVLLFLLAVILFVHGDYLRRVNK